MRASRNIKLTLAYDGTNYHGWQIQPKFITIQGEVRRAVGKITGERVSIVGSGRTDAGVHARALVANFRTRCAIAALNFKVAINGLLPKDIRILHSSEVPPSFHARFSARSKVYRYQIYRGRILPPHLLREYCHFPYPLQTEALEKAASLFVGVHDFASFTTARRLRVGQSSGTVRRVEQSRILRRGHHIFFTVEADGFLQHMVRRMIGTLLQVARERMTLVTFKQLLNQRNSSLARHTAPAHGLTLLRVRY